MYDTSALKDPVLKNFSFKPPQDEVGIDFEAVPVIESLCIYDSEDTQICTPNTDSTEDDYTMLVLERSSTDGVSNLGNGVGGMFGLSPQGKDDNMTLARYFHKLKLTSENQITL